MGYKSKLGREITTNLLTQKQVDIFQYPANKVGKNTIQNFTQTDGTVLYKIVYSVEEPNPISDVDFGKIIVQKKFAEREVKLESDAVLVRSKNLYIGM